MLKRKNIYVIIVSVLIVFLVIISSFLGLIIYLQWRQLNFTINYYETLERFDTISNAKNISIETLILKDSPSHHLRKGLKAGLGFEGLPFVEGIIKNNGKRAVVSAAIEVAFLDILGQPVYRYTIYPLEPFRPPRLFRKIHLPNLMFLKDGAIRPGKSRHFKCTIWRCPKKFVKMLKENSFSNQSGEWSGRIKADVASIRLR